MVQPLLTHPVMPTLDGRKVIFWHHFVHEQIWQLTQRRLQQILEAKHANTMTHYSTPTGHIIGQFLFGPKDISGHKNQLIFK
jgi:hypothetical protein